MKDEKESRKSAFVIGRSILNVGRLLFRFILHPSSFVLYSLLFLLLPPLLRGEVFVYRDAAHFYYPLFEWTAREWGAGRVPLWNPQENLGVPVVGEATSSVFYPGKLVFALPLFSFGTRYMLYIVSHIALAACTAYVVARRWGASTAAAAACALPYACGGSVLFQIYNVIYLVSAAWLPLAFLCAEQMLVKRSWKQAVLFGATLALMTLGGDPQTAYQAGMIAVLGALFVGRRTVGRPFRAVTDEPKEATAQKGHPTVILCLALARIATSRVSLLGLAAGSGALLAAVQILPALEWSRLSDRAAYSRPRNLYEAWEYLHNYEAHHGNLPITQSGVLSEIGRGLAADPPAGSHHEAVYDYSLSPWRLAETVWPNFSGKPFPENRRWIAAIPAQGKSWSPSLYAGLLPLLLGLASLRFWKGEPRERWLSWTLVLSVLAAFGWYGLGWISLEIQTGVIGPGVEPLSVGAPTGGLYWFFVMVLPGYVLFRYPEKWLVPAALALSLLAAKGWDRCWSSGFSRLRHTECAYYLRWAIAFIGGVSCVGCLAMFWLSPRWALLFAGLEPDDYFGPLDAAGSWRDLTWAFGQTSVLCGVFWWLMGRLAFNESAMNRASWIALAITAAELVFAQRGLIATAPDAVWSEPSLLAEAIAQHSAPEDAHQYRVFRAAPEGWLSPKSWSDAGANRQQEMSRWERETLFPRYHLLEREPRVSLVESITTMTPNDYSEFLRIAKVKQVGPKGALRVPQADGLSVLSSKYLVLPAGLRCDTHERIAEHNGTILWRNPRAWPRAFVTHILLRGDVPTRGDPTSLDWSTRFMIDVVASAPMAVVEPPDAIPTKLRSMPPPVNQLPRECRIVRDDPQQVEIEATLESPGLMVFGDLYYPGWVAETRDEATGETTPLEIVRTNRIMRGVFLPGGKHYVTFAYRPKPFYWGALVSGLAWSALATGAVFAFARRRRRAEQARPLNGCT